MTNDTPLAVENVSFPAGQSYLSFCHFPSGVADYENARHSTSSESPATQTPTLRLNRKWPPAVRPLSYPALYAAHLQRSDFRNGLRSISFDRGLPTDPR